jgi:hypothetical protein
MTTSGKVMEVTKVMEVMEVMEVMKVRRGSDDTASSILESVTHITRDSGVMKVM